LIFISSLAKNLVHVEAPDDGGYWPKLPGRSSVARLDRATPAA
jgi:hypothetical protein